MPFFFCTIHIVLYWLYKRRFYLNKKKDFKIDIGLGRPVLIKYSDSTISKTIKLHIQNLLYFQKGGFVAQVLAFKLILKYQILTRVTTSTNRAKLTLAVTWDS